MKAHTFRRRSDTGMRRSRILSPKTSPKAPPISDTKELRVYVASSRIIQFCSASLTETVTNSTKVQIKFWKIQEEATYVGIFWTICVEGWAIIFNFVWINSRVLRLNLSIKQNQWFQNQWFWIILTLVSSLWIAMGTCWWALVCIVAQVRILMEFRQTSSLFEKIAHFDIGKFNTIVNFWVVVKIFIWAQITETKLFICMKILPYLGWHPQVSMTSNKSS